MTSPTKPLGVLKPFGGGDPVPLMKDEILIGRRPTCDIRLDFENISGKHCQLRYFQGVWHVRDLGSTNGTTVNGHKAASDQSVMPDDELMIASHPYSIEYDPAVAPGTLINANQFLDDDYVEAPRQRSLLELAGLETTDDDRRDRPPPKPAPPRERRPRSEPEPPDPTEHHVSSEGVTASDDDFFEMIKEDVVDEEDNRKGRLS